jgi:hypothetical protein
MSAALMLTGADLVRALGAVKALPAVDAAIARRADEVAGALAWAGTETRVLKRGDGDYLVTVSGAGVFAREFGSVAEPAAPFIAAALAEAGKP